MKASHVVAMAAGSSEAASASREFSEDDLADLCDALHKVSTKYKFFGLQIGLKMHDIRGIAAKHSDSSDCLLEILSARLNQESALTCADIVKALKSPSVGDHSLAIEFQKQFESIIHKDHNEKESEYSKKKKTEKPREKSEDESKSNESENIQKAKKSANLDRQVHERDEPKSKRAKKRARKKENATKNRFASEQPEPDEYKEYERKQIKGKQKQKIHFLKMALSPQSGAESEQKRKRLLKESEKVMSTESENESSDMCKEVEIVLSRSEKVRGSAAYSEVKHQPQSAKIREVKNEARKKGMISEKEGSTKKQSCLHRMTAADVESDEDTSEGPHKKLEAEETESEESSSESTSDESERDSLKHKEILKPKSPMVTGEIYHDSEEEIEKVRAKDKKKMPQKSKLATAKSSPLSERKEQYKRKKGRSLDLNEQEREYEIRAKASRSKLHRYYSQQRKGESMTNSGIKTKKPAADFSKQTSDESETDPHNEEESDSGNDSSENGEDAEEKSSDEEEKTETGEESFTSPSEEEVKRKKKEERSLSHGKHKAKKRVSEEERKLEERRANKSSLVHDLPRGERGYETHTRKVKGKRVSEGTSLKYDSPGDDEQSDAGHGSRDQKEHDIQQKRRNKKKQSIMTPTAVGSSSPSKLQKNQPISKKQGHRKKHVRKMKEKRERMKKEKAAYSSGTDDSSPECDMTKNQYEGEMKELVNVFERFFGKLCRTVFDPVDTAAELQRRGLITIDVMKHMMLSPESQQEKIITLVDRMHMKIKSCPNHLFVIVEVMLENEALQEIAKEILSEAGI